MQSKFSREGTRPGRKLRPPTFWSFSRWQDFVKCPRMYEGRWILKIQAPKAAALQRGIDIHKAGENYLRGVDKKVPATYRDFIEEMQTLRKLEFIPEASWAVTKTWQPCSPTDWDNAWLRGKGDACLMSSEGTLDIIDFKTGRPYSAHEEQASIVAAIGMMQFPEAAGVHFENWYLDSNEVSTYTFDRKKSLRKLKEQWGKEGRRILSAAQFEPTPSVNSCRFCPLRSDQQLADGSMGTCREWKKTLSEPL